MLSLSVSTRIRLLTLPTEFMIELGSVDYVELGRAKHTSIDTCQVKTLL